MPKHTEFEPSIPNGHKVRFTTTFVLAGPPVEDYGYVPGYAQPLSTFSDTGLVNYSTFIVDKNFIRDNDARLQTAVGDPGPSPNRLGNWVTT